MVHLVNTVETKAQGRTCAVRTRPQAAASAAADVRNPITGEPDSGHISDADPAADEVWVDLKPFNSDWDELGLDGPA